MRHVIMMFCCGNLLFSLPLEGLFYTVTLIVYLTNFLFPLCDMLAGIQQHAVPAKVQNLPLTLSSFAFSMVTRNASCWYLTC